MLARKITPPDSCGRHWPNPCGPKFCQYRGDRRSRQQLAADEAADEAAAQTEDPMLPINARLHGSQPHQPLTPDDLVFIRTGADPDREIIVRDSEDHHFELWTLYPSPAHYSIEYAGRRYEYVRRMTEQEVLDLP